MSRLKKTVLYFTAESGLSDDEAREMERIPGARHRNAAMIDPDAPLEKCDGVAGPAIPDNYADAFPLARALVEDEEEAEETDDPNAMTVAQLKAALDEAGVEYPATAKKAALVALYEQNIE